MVALELDEYIWAQWSYTRLAFICAPLGFGKTEFARRMLQGQDILEIDAERDDVTKLVTTQNATRYDAVLLDNIHDDLSTAAGSELASVIKQCDRTRFVFTSRAPMPGWLTPFFARGEVLVVTAEDLYFSDTDIAHLLAANNLTATPALVDRIAEVTSGYPMAVSLAIAHMLRGDVDTWERSLFNEVMLYFDAEFKRRFSPRVQDLLMLVPFFDYIEKDMVLCVLGADDGKELLDVLQHTTCFVTPEGDAWAVNPGVRAFFEWERTRRHNDASYYSIIDHAVDYYVTHGNYISALELCSRTKNNRRMLAILEEHAKLNPGYGSYCELGHYYHALPEDIVRASPRLMRIMSLLDSMLMDTGG